jgi:hypothetical protein
MESRTTEKPDGPPPSSVAATIMTPSSVPRRGSDDERVDADEKIRKQRKTSHKKKQKLQTKCSVGRSSLCPAL